MNIIIIHSHDTGRYIEPYGYAVSTPNLMQLAREGTVFRQAHSAAPTCSPSRAGMLSGMAPHSAGMFGLTHRGFEMNDYSKHLASYLSNNGFETVLSGVQHEAIPAEKLGCDRILRPVERPASHKESDLVHAELAADYIRNKGRAGGNKGKPFFLFYGLFLPHRPFIEPEEPDAANYVSLPHQTADTPENRKDMAAYIASASWMDHCAGTVLDAVKESGLEDETIVIYTTDHGIAFPGMKCTLHDTGTGVSLIIKYPANSLAGQVSDALISHIDLFPTLCDLAGVDKPSWLQGNSLLPIFHKAAEEVNSYIFSEVTYHAAYEPMRSIRSKQFKLIRYFDDYDRCIPANIDDSPPKKLWLDHGLLDKQREKVQLYDLYLDPLEQVNVINEPEYADVQQALFARLEDWMAATSDPLLQGKIEKPEGAKINRKESISANEKAYE